MPCAPSNRRQKPRDLRRRVMLRARVRVGGAWSDASILNLSPRGLMINASAASPGSGHFVEVRHGEFVILAEVVWREGTRAGLRSESRVPVEDMLALDSASSLAVREPVARSGHRVRGDRGHHRFDGRWHDRHCTARLRTADGAVSAALGQ